MLEKVDQCWLLQALTASMAQYLPSLEYSPSLRRGCDGKIQQLMTTMVAMNLETMGMVAMMMEYRLLAADFETLGLMTMMTELHHLLLASGGDAGLVLPQT